MAIINRAITSIFGKKYGSQGSNVGYTVYGPDNSEIVSRTISDIAEVPTASGCYRAVVALDDTASGYILWDITGSPGIIATEDFGPNPVVLNVVGLDSTLLPDIASDADMRSSGGKMLRALVDRFFDKVEETDTTQTVYNDADAAILTMTISDDTVTVTKTKSS